jgi:hypothetical protein
MRFLHCAAKAVLLKQTIARPGFDHECRLTFQERWTAIQRRRSELAIIGACEDVQLISLPASWSVFWAPKVGNSCLEAQPHQCMCTHTPRLNKGTLTACHARELALTLSRQQYVVVPEQPPHQYHVTVHQLAPAATL